MVTDFCSSVTLVETPVSRGRRGGSTARYAEIITTVIPLALAVASIAPLTGLLFADAISGPIVTREEKGSAQTIDADGCGPVRVAAVGGMSLLVLVCQAGGRKARVPSIGRSNPSAVLHVFKTVKEAVKGRYAGISHDRTGTQMGKITRGTIMSRNVR